jgi:hypothetical protein
MAKSKLRMTGFARLLIAMIVILPLAFLGATFIKGGDGLTDLKEMMGISSSDSEVVKDVEADVSSESIDIPPTPPPAMEKVGQSEEVMNELRDKLNEMYDENSALKEEILELKKQLELKE